VAGKVRRFIIVGNGAAGVAAAEAIRELDRRATLVIVSDESHAHYSRPGLAYLLTRALPEAMLHVRTEEELRRLRAERIHERAVRIHAWTHTLELESGRALSYDALLLATGAGAVLPNLPGIDLRGVVTLDTLDDARRVLSWARRARRAVVVGGGITAVELAEGFSALGLQVDYLLRKDRYWSSVLDPVESQMIEAGLVTRGVAIRPRTELSQVLGKRGKVVGVRTARGEEIRCELVGVAVGVRPRTRLAKEAGLDVDRGVLVNEFMQTGQPQVYAAGDVAQVHNPHTNTYDLSSLWGVAREQGRVAGANMAGERTVYRALAPRNITRLGGIIVTILGAVGRGQPDADLMAITHGDSETWRHQLDAFVFEHTQGPNRVRVLMDQRHVVGAVLLGDRTLDRPLSYLIDHSVDLSPIRAELERRPELLPELLIQRANLEADRDRKADVRVA
jgi:NAD(P)H-nitrite reductase large subunit